MYDEGVLFLLITIKEIGRLCIIDLSSSDEPFLLWKYRKSYSVHDSPLACFAMIS